MLAWACTRYTCAQGQGPTHGGAEGEGKGMAEVPKLAPQPWGGLGQKPPELRGERALKEFVLKLGTSFPCL